MVKSRWCRWWGRGFALLMAVCVGYLGFEHVRGRIAFQRRISELAARGERLSIVALEPPRPAADQNAATWLFQLTNSSLEVATTWTNAPPSPRFPHPGQALVTWRLKAWSRDGKATNSWDQVGSQLLLAREALVAIRSAAAKPVFDGGVDYRKGFVDFQIGPLATIKRAAQTLFVAADYELSRGQLDEAHADVLDLVKLCASQKSEPLVISQLIRAAFATLAFHSTWKILQAPGGADAQFAALQEAWERADFAGDMAAAFEMERAMQVDFFDQILASRSKLGLVVGKQEVLSEPFNWFATDGLLLRWVNLPLWQIAWARQEQLRGLERWQELIEHERLARTNSWAALRSHLTSSSTLKTSFWTGSSSEDERPSIWQRVRFPFSAGPFALSDLTIRKSLTAHAQQQLAISALAIRRYQMRTGQVPKDLSALVPNYLKALPRDPMDGGILRYRTTTDEGFVLYSVGVNGHDDGGDPALNSEDASFREIWNGRDGVWPTPATPSNADEAMRWTKD